MLLYSLKRFLLSVPVLWLLITIVFLLSRLLPGTYGSESILYADGSSLVKSSQQQRDNIYKSYLERTGQNLPLFYFGLTSSAIPVQVTSPLPGIEQRVEQLSWKFGDPENAIGFTNRLTNILRLLEKYKLTEQAALAYKLQHTLHPDSIQFYTASLAHQLSSGPMQKAAADLRVAAVKMVAATNSFAYLVPSIQWHGASNQYHHWLSLLLKGDMGNSYRDARPVSEILWESFSNTFWLIISSMLLAFILALELSIIMVRKTHITWNRVLLPVLYILDSIPLFVLSLILLILFATPDFLTLFPVFGLGFHTDQSDSWYGAFMTTFPYLVLPVTCLVIANLPYLTNQIYRSLSDTLQANFIKTAHSKGLKETRIIRKHALRNALLPVITILSDFLPALVAGTVVIETIFAIPGIGRLLFTAVLARDFPVILGIVLIIALVKMVSHMLADICYAQADPRVRKDAVA